jgi:hypothetical protein
VNTLDEAAGPAAVGESLEGRSRLRSTSSEEMSRTIASGQVMARGPLIFDVLQEFRIPRALRRARVAPEQDELRQQLACECDVDVGHAQDVVHILARLPVGRDRPRLLVVFERVAVPCPLAADVRDELRIPGARVVAALAPVEDELGNGVLDEFAVDAGALEDLQRVGARIPHGLWRGGWRACGA